MEQFSKKFKISELTIYETDYWIWSLRPIQVTLGAGILSLKRECSVLNGLEPNEFSDLYNIIRVIELTLKDAFDYDIINYLMLMMVDKQVHYHVIPRYEDKLCFGGESWMDLGWPGIPDLSGEELNINILTDIKNHIKTNLKY